MAEKKESISQNKRLLGPSISQPTDGIKTETKQQNKSETKSRKDQAREKMSMEQIDELFEAFTLFDKDYDGAINKLELSTIMKSIGLNATDSEIQEMLAEADTAKHNENKEKDKKEIDKQKIDFPEFLAFLARKTVENEPVESTIEKIFSAFDISGKENTKDKLISAKDLMKFLESIEEPYDKKEIRTLFQESSIYGSKKLDGKVGFWEELSIGYKDLELMLESDKNKNIPSNQQN